MSASLENGKVTRVEITSEAGAQAKDILPWKDGGTIITRIMGNPLSDESYFETDTKKGEKIYLKPL